MRQAMSRPTAVGRLGILAMGIGHLIGGCGLGPSGDAGLPMSVTVDQPMEQGDDQGGPETFAPESLDGTWALHIELPVRWAGIAPVLQAGEGTIVQYARVDRTWSGGGYDDRIRVCGIELPETLLGEKRLKLEFDPRVFDDDQSPDAPEFVQVRSHFEGNPGLGSTIASDVAAFMLGGTIDDPATAPWMGGVNAQVPRGPGLRAKFRNDEDYKRPPAGITRSHEIVDVRIITRNVESIRTVVNNVNHLQGPVTVQVLHGILAMNSWTVSARQTARTNLDPRDNEIHPVTDLIVTMFNNWRPVYSLRADAEAVATMVRIDPSAACADIRSLDY